jgi:hypothetical protein
LGFKQLHLNSSSELKWKSYRWSGLWLYSSEV